MGDWSSRGLSFYAAHPVGASLDPCEVFWRQELGGFSLSTLKNAQDGNGAVGTTAVYAAERPFVAEPGPTP